MDTEAQPTERDRAPLPPDEENEGHRSRFSCVSGLAARVPGGRITLIFLLCMTFLLLIGRFVMQPFEIPSGSMEPGLRIGDRVLVNKVAYRFGAQPQRGDVVVFDGTGYFGAGDYVKRVEGVGGDHVVCCDSQGEIEVNGEPVHEPYLYPGDAPSTVRFDVTVPEGTLFVLGDHRDRSSDSRDHLGSPGGGMVPLDAVLGRAEWVVWPLGHRGSVARDGGHG